MTQDSKSQQDEITIGELLRQKRQDLGLSKIFIAMQINLKEKDISAIEDNKFDKISPNLYLNGVILQYAKILKINKKLVASKIKNLNNIKKKSSRSSLDIDAPKIHSPSIQALFGSIICTIILMLIILFYNHFEIKKQHDQIDSFIQSHHSSNN